MKTRKLINAHLFKLSSSAATKVIISAMSSSETMFKMSTAGLDAHQEMTMPLTNGCGNDDGVIQLGSLQV